MVIQKLDFIEPGGPVTRVRYGASTSLSKTRFIPAIPVRNILQPITTCTMLEIILAAFRKSRSTLTRVLLISRKRLGRMLGVIPLVVTSSGGIRLQLVTHTCQSRRSSLQGTFLRSFLRATSTSQQTIGRVAYLTFGPQALKRQSTGVIVAQVSNMSLRGRKM